MASIGSGNLLFPKVVGILIKDATTGVDIAAPTGVTFPTGTTNAYSMVQALSGSWCKSDASGLTFYTRQFAVITTVAGSFGQVAAYENGFIVFDASAVYRYSLLGVLTNTYSALTGTSGPGAIFAMDPSTFSGTEAFSFRTVAGTTYLTRLSLSGSGSITNLLDLTPYGTPLSSGQGIAVDGGSVYTVLQNGTSWAVHRILNNGTYITSAAVVSGGGTYISAVAHVEAASGAFWVSYWDGAAQNIKRLDQTGSTTYVSFTIPAADDGNFVEVLLGALETATYIPAGTIAIGGFGDDGLMRFLSADGSIDYGQPPSFPNTGGGLSDLARTSDGNIVGVGGGGSPGNGLPYWVNTGAGSFNAADLTQLNGAPSSAAVGGFAVGTDGFGYWYTARVDSGFWKVAKWDTTPVVAVNAGSWNITIPAGYNAIAGHMCVTEDGLNLYLTTPQTAPNGSKSWIHKLSLVGAGSYVGTVGADYDVSPFTDFRAVPDGSGDFLHAFRRVNNVSGASTLRRITSAGATVWDATLPSGPGSAADLTYFGIGLGVPGDTHFLTWAYDDTTTTYSGVRYWWVEYATGLPDNTRNFVPEDGSFEFDSQIVILSVAIGTPPLDDSTEDDFEDDIASFPLGWLELYTR